MSLFSLYGWEPENEKMSNFSKKKMVASDRPRNAARSDFMNVALSWVLREDMEGKYRTNSSKMFLWSGGYTSR